MSKKKSAAETSAVVVTAVEETANVKPATKAKTNQNVTVMYIGPSIPNVVQASTVFKYGILPEALNKFAEGKPYIKKLLVPIQELPAAMKELNSGKGALSTIYRKVKNEI